MFIMSCVAVAATMISCNDPGVKQAREEMNDAFRQDREMITGAIRHHSPDLQKVDIIGNTVVYTQIIDGIIDIKTYTYDGNVCVEAERVYVFPTQMSALRHYRRAVEQAELYDNIQLFNNEVKYDLKAQQHELEAKGLTKEQLKAKFDQHIEAAKADLQKCDHKDDKCCKK